MRCIYRYRDGARCVWTGDTVMCPAHTLIDRGVQKKAAKQAADKAKVKRDGLPAAIQRPARRREKFGQPSRVQTAREVVDKVKVACLDTTAPWGCGRGACAPCAGKPSYEAWREAKCQVSAE